MVRKRGIKDTDYLFISTYLRCREKYLLTSSRMERMIHAASGEEAVKVLGEMGYSDFSPHSDRELGEALERERKKLFEDISRYVPDPRVVDVFRIRYDYHNLKTLLKAKAVGMDGRRLLIGAGRIPVAVLVKAVAEQTWEILPKELASAARESEELLLTSGDPRKSDILLDRSYYREMLQTAEATGSALLVRYVRTSIDSANLRTVVRARRMGWKDSALGQILCVGGTVSPERVAAAALDGKLENAFFATPLHTAAALGEQMEDSLVAFEKACDDAVTACVVGAKETAFGVEAVIGYLVAKEVEFTAIRIILSGRMAGIGGDKLRERLRESYG